eukprot:2175376-Amphidinium_carterae.1
MSASRTSISSRASLIARCFSIDVSSQNLARGRASNQNNPKMQNGCDVTIPPQIQSRESYGFACWWNYFCDNTCWNCEGANSHKATQQSYIDMVNL